MALQLRSLLFALSAYGLVFPALAAEDSPEDAAAPQSVEGDVSADTGEAPTNPPPGTEADLFKTLPEFDFEFQGVDVMEEITVIASPSLLPKTPGIPFNRRQLSANVQLKTAEDIRRSGAVTTTDFLNTEFQSVTVNDTSGNPFRQDINFRGFSASPLIATPQGISVYFDGVRINESFGDIINWDLIPLIALDTVSLIPGSNPMFGRNTIAGALTLGTKSGFTAPGFDLNMLYGSWNRFQTQASAGASNEHLAGFIAFNQVTEDGWRLNSPSKVQQFFGRGDLTTDLIDISVSALMADTNLVGNGTVPYTDYVLDPKQVFTSPDITNNSLAQYTARGTIYPTYETAVSATLYRRDVMQRTQSGDFWDDFERLDFTRQGYDCRNVPTINAPFSGANGFGSFSFLTGSESFEEPGVPGCFPNGVFNNGELDQLSQGFSVQFTFANDFTEFVFGVNRDTGSVRFSQEQLLGFIDDDRQVVVNPGLQIQQLPFSTVAECTGFGLPADFCAERLEQATLGGFLLPAKDPILRNFLEGSTYDLAFYFFNALSISDAATLSFGIRHNRSKVKNFLQSDLPSALWTFKREDFGDLPLECITDENPDARYQCTEEELVFDSWNPAVGMTFDVDEDHTLHFNHSYGTRTPSPIELACARPEKEDGLIIGCTIPTNLTNDPPLEQVSTRTLEFGIRKYVGEEIELNATAFQTKLENDILFISLGRGGRGVFDNFGKTQREGVEFGVSDGFGRLQWFLNYTFLKATFESVATVVNSSNSTAAQGYSVINEFSINPGDNIPGIPDHSLRAGMSFDITPKFNVATQLIAQSGAFAQGNENNEHSPTGDDQFANGKGAGDPLNPCEPFVQQTDGSCFTGGRPFVGEGKIKPFWIVNLDFTYRPSDEVTLKLNVDNLFNRRFETVGNLGLSPFQSDSVNFPGAVDGAGFNFNAANWKHDLFVGPGAPRAAWMSVNWQY